MVEASITNGVDSTMAQVNECNALYGKYPSFILVSSSPRARYSMCHVAY